MLLELSFGALCAVVAMESAVLQSMIREVLWLDRLTASDGADGELHPLDAAFDAPSPTFSLPVLDSEERITNATLRNRPTTMLFITRADVEQIGMIKFRTMIHSLITLSDFGIYVVCEDDLRTCRWIGEQIALLHLARGKVSLLVGDSSLRRQLYVEETLIAVFFDRSGRIKKVGSVALESEPVGDTEVRAS